ncbi:hypothetical protein Tco_0328561, partial [Tanacetum coccineum]
TQRTLYGDGEVEMVAWAAGDEVVMAYGGEVTARLDEGRLVWFEWRMCGVRMGWWWVDEAVVVRKCGGWARRRLFVACLVSATEVFDECIKQAYGSKCLSGLRGVALPIDLSLCTSGPFQDPTIATTTAMTITNGDGMRRVRTFRETISLE